MSINSLDASGLKLLKCWFVTPWITMLRHEKVLSSPTTMPLLIHWNLIILKETSRKAWSKTLSQTESVQWPRRRSEPKATQLEVISAGPILTSESAMKMSLLRTIIMVRMVETLKEYRDRGLDSITSMFWSWRRIRHLVDILTVRWLSSMTRSDFKPRSPPSRCS